MNCPKCGKELNENQKFCSECGAKIGESDMQDIINIKWLVISIAAIALVFGTCILATQNSPSANTSNNNVNNEVVEDTNTDEETTAYTEEPQEPEKPVAPKPNCVYETSDGVCFTTQLFKATPMHYYDCTGGWTTYLREKPACAEVNSYGISQCYYPHDSWAGAMKACKDWGYQLPNAYELNSLAKDILGTVISNEIDEFSSKAPDKRLNLVPIEKLKPDINSKDFNIFLWENADDTSSTAYMRVINVFENKWGYQYSDTRRGKGIKDAEALRFIPWAVCVYDPYGVAKEKYVLPKPVPKPTDDKYNKEAEDALF